MFCLEVASVLSASVRPLLCGHWNFEMLQIFPKWYEDSCAVAFCSVLDRLPFLPDQLWPLALPSALELARAYLLAFLNAFRVVVVAAAVVEVAGVAGVGIAGAAVLEAVVVSKK